MKRLQKGLMKRTKYKIYRIFKNGNMAKKPIAILEANTEKEVWIMFSLYALQRPENWRYEAVKESSGSPITSEGEK